MPLEADDLDGAFNTRVRDSFNTTTTNNSATLGVDLDDVGNTDNSVRDSGNADLSATGSFHDDSYNTDIDAEHSGNTDSYNDIDDSAHDNSDHSVDDHSVSVGNRVYDTGFNDLTFGAAGAAGAAAAGGGTADDRDTVVDQSLNANVVTHHGDVEQLVGSEAVVASGDGALAAGGDIDIDTSWDASTTIEARGDVNLDNTVDVTTVVGSFNEYTDNSTETDTSIDLDIDDSFNDESETYTADNSFNDELTSVETSDWNVDADVIWGSEEAAITEDVDIDLPPL